MIGPVATGTVAGFGFDSYRLALEAVTVTDGVTARDRPRALRSREQATSPCGGPPITVDQQGGRRRGRPLHNPR